MTLAEGGEWGRYRSQGFLLMPAADTGHIAVATFMKPCQASHRDAETNNSLPSNVLQGYLKTSFIYVLISSQIWVNLRTFLLCQKMHSLLPSTVMIQDGPICPRVGSGQPIWVCCCMAKIGTLGAFLRVKSLSGHVCHLA